MTQAERDRLVTLKQAKKRVITQGQAAEELGLSVRQVKRLLKELKKRGDRAVTHGLRGKPSNNKIEDEVREAAVTILRQDVYRGFGPTLASEYLANKHGMEVSRETVRRWMVDAGLWRPHPQRLEEVHLYRARRSRCGELVQWDTSEHDWLEGRGERLYLIAMIDDATSRLYARFVRSDSSEENLRTLWEYLERYGRPLAFYTDRASLFQTTVKSKRGQQREDQEGVEMAPTQIGRALRELKIAWIPAYSPQAKGRVERSFATAQDRLVKGMRADGVNTLQEANEYLEREFLPWWKTTLTVEPAQAQDAHRKLDESYQLAAILSHVETRQVKPDYTFQIDAQRYQIQRSSVCTGLRGAKVRVECRLDGTVAARFRERYLQITAIAESVRPAQAQVRPRATPAGTKAAPKTKSQWMTRFSVRGGPSLKKAIGISNATS
jgi:transposase